MEENNRRKTTNFLQSETFKSVILPALVSVFVVFLSNLWEDFRWANRQSIERELKLIDKRLELVERTSLVFSKVHYVQDIYEKELFSNKEPSEEITKEMAKIRSEIWGVLYLDQQFFGSKTKKVIDSVLMERPDSVSWWMTGEQDYNKIISAMSNEMGAGINE